MMASRIRTLTCGVGAGCALALLASASLWVSPTPSDVAGTALSAHPSQIRLACPAGTLPPPPPGPPHRRRP